MPSLLEMLRADEADIARVGEIAIARAHSVGVSAFYIDRDLDPAGRIIEHHPDGTRKVHGLKLGD